MKAQDQVTNGWWAVVSWLLTAVFFFVSYFYAMHDSVIGWIIWLVLSAIWLYFAVNATNTFLKNRR